MAPPLPASRARALALGLVGLGLAMSTPALCEEIAGGAPPTKA